MKGQKLKFQSKARNLLALKKARESGALSGFEILDLVILNKADLQDSRQKILAKIRALNAPKLIVRSSSQSEDSSENSNAGAFLSLANISANDENAVFEALQKVAASMPNDDSDEILVQPYLERISACGVAFSVDKDNFAPYFCVQFDESGSSASVTDGSVKNSKHFFAYRDDLRVNDAKMSRLIAMIRQLESIYKCEFLDVEFAFALDLACGEASVNSPSNSAKNSQNLNKNSQNATQETLYLLQVRPLVMKGKQNLFRALPKEALSRLYKRLENLKERRPGVLGDSFIYGVMPDWNPAEIIGLRPKRLALSLYKAIITDNVWAYQRDNYGYKDLRAHPLMHSFLGMPYIDVRVSLNSFVPKALDEKIAQKLVNFYEKTLIKNPHLHDKIEFDIVFANYHFSVSQRLKILLKNGFNENEIKRIEFALLNLTNSVINPENSLFRKDILKAKKLQNAFLQIKNSRFSLIDKIYWLIETCKRQGTLPFAGVARAAFIGVSMLNSLVEINFLSLKERDEFLNSLNTVSKNLAIKSANLNEQNLREFLAEFGHLRAGTYNILSPRYDENYARYFDLKNGKKSVKIHAFKLSKKRQNELDIILKQNGLNIDAAGFFEFLKDSIEGREFLKFEFSKLLSYAIELIAQLGEYYGIAREDMAHLDAQSIFTLYSSLYSKNPKERFLDEIKRHKGEYELTLALKLPPLLYEPSQVYSFFSTNITPNFITQKSVVGELASENESDLRGKIVLIKSADPGYDYLFSKEILGLITCYGGANSHMAIRASELNLPSVIGVGEEKFGELLNAKRVRIECASEQIIAL